MDEKAGSFISDGLPGSAHGVSTTPSMHEINLAAISESDNSIGVNSASISR